MAIAGTIERSSSITLPRVLERIFDQEQPGLLRLRHRESGRIAIFKIDRGAVQEMVFGDLKGDAAMREVSGAFPLEYEFESSDTSITTGRLPVQPVMRAGKKPALKLVGAVKPMMVLSGLTPSAAAASPSAATARVPASAPASAPAASQVVESVERKPAARFMQEKRGPQPLPAPAEPGQAKEQPRQEIPSKDAVEKSVALPPPPMRRVSSLPSVESLTEWVGAGDEFVIRFAGSAALTLGAVGEADMDYFRTDSASLLERAALIGEVLGFSAPGLAAIVEPERAAGYRRLADGFSGIYCGPDSTVDTLLAIL